jgi:hypothetical protein
VAPFLITLQIGASGALFGLLDKIPPQYGLTSKVNDFNTNHEIVYCSSPNVDSKDLTSILNNMVPYIGRQMKFKPFESVSKIDDYLASFKTDNVFAGIVFEKVDFSQRDFKYTIMYNSTDRRTLPQINHILTKSIQEIVNTTNPISKNAFEMFAPISSQKSILFLQSGPYFLCLSVTFLISVFAQLIVEEKEMKIKDQLILVNFKGN